MRLRPQVTSVTLATARQICCANLGRFTRDASVVYLVHVRMPVEDPSGSASGALASRTKVCPKIMVLQGFIIIIYIISLFCLKCPKPRELQYWSRPLFWANLSSCSQMVVPTCSPSCEYVLLPTGTGSGGLVDLDFRSLWKTGLQ